MSLLDLFWLLLIFIALQPTRTTPAVEYLPIPRRTKPS
jgi:hypothetical protein